VNPEQQRDADLASAVLLGEETVAAMRAVLPGVAERTVAGIIEAVPSYSDALTGAMGETIRFAVETALGGFVHLAGQSSERVQEPTSAAIDGAYQLGRGEARSGRTVDALLSAYRIGARISWRELSEAAVRSGIDADTLGHFAGLVFAYIEQLSAASLAGHTDELENTGRVLQRQLERLAAALLDGASHDVVTAAVEAAGWSPPETLTAVLVPESQLRGLRSRIPGETLQAAKDTSGADVVLLVPDVHGRRRRDLLRTVADHQALAGPARPWERSSSSYARALRVRALGGGPDSEDHLVDLVLSADAEAVADLRARVLAPLDDVRDSSAEKLVETLRAWLRHQGRREAVAEELFVHPQTVRYRLGRLRELYGDALEDPETLLQLTVALAAPDPGDQDQSLA
jgi:hypothetical protein